MEFDNEIVFRIPAPSDGIETVLVLFGIAAILVAVLAALQHRDKVARIWEWVTAHPWEKASPSVNLLSWAALICVGPIAAILFVMAVGEAFELLQQTGGSDSSVGSLGRGAVIVALIGAPFVIWRSLVAQKTVTLQEQGHITDRINTAVQGLGAEKEGNKIGRPVTIWTGSPKTTTYLVDDYEKFELPPRSLEMQRYKDVTPMEDVPKGADDVFEGLHVKVKIWPKERTIIEWQGKSIQVEEPEHIGIVENWQVFTETQPNLEVRIGAIYALERIAQDSDRDHVQIMEILCAYIRQNAPAPETDEWPELEMHEGEEDGPLEADWEERLQAFRNKQESAKAALRVREDIQVALTVIGRRSAKQRRLEAGRGKEADFPFDSPCPEYEGPDAGHDPDALDAFLRALRVWQKTLLRYRSYRLDLRGADLRGAYLGGFNLKGARLHRTCLLGADLGLACLQGADLTQSLLQGANLKRAYLQGARLMRARLQGSDLKQAHSQGALIMEARLQGANLQRARLQGADLRDAQLQGAIIMEARLQGADLGEARLQGSQLVVAGLQGARLWKARLQGAELGAAKLHGANFGGTQLQGADLVAAQFDKRTQLIGASLSFAAVKGVDFSDTPRISSHLTEIFGDGSVVLPEGSDVPANWPKLHMDYRKFDEEWRKWQHDPEGYHPPDSPGPADPA